MRSLSPKSVFDHLAEFSWWGWLIIGEAVFCVFRFFVPSEGLIGSALHNGALFLVLPFLILSGISIYNLIYRHKLLRMQPGLESIRKMSWRDFRLLVGEALRNDGFSVEEREFLESESGTDLVLRKDGHKILVQCKRWDSEEVNALQLRELYDSMLAEKAHAGLFLTTGAFTPQARAFSEGKSLVLADGPLLLEMVKTVQQNQDYAFNRYLRRASLEEASF